MNFWQQPNNNADVILLIIIISLQERKVSRESGKRVNQIKVKCNVTVVLHDVVIDAHCSVHTGFAQRAVSCSLWLKNPKYAAYLQNKEADSLHRLPHAFIFYSFCGCICGCTCWLLWSSAKQLTRGMRKTNHLAWLCDCS